MIRLSARILMSPDELLDKVRTARKGWLYKAGAYVRRAARNSIKKGRTEEVMLANSFGRYQRFRRRVHSSPGQPPRDYSGWRKTFHFEVDNASEIVSVGPIAGRRGIPPIHEYGGAGTVRWRELDWHGRWHTFTRSAYYAPRPTMQPALEKSKAAISQFWANAIK